MLVISTWLWGDKYGPDDVAKLRAGFERHLQQPHRFVCFTDRLLFMRGIQTEPIHDIGLTRVPGCFARLRMFDPVWQRAHIQPDDRLVCCDLDTVIVNQMDTVLNRPEDFVILQGANSVNPNPYCGALMMLCPGAHPELWNDFSLEAVKEIKYHEFPDDQGWIWHRVPNAAGWKAGTNGVYAFCKPGWPRGSDLPSDARMVTFNGWRSPEKFKDLPWVREHWRK